MTAPITSGFIRQRTFRDGPQTTNASDVGSRGRGIAQGTAVLPSAFTVLPSALYEVLSDPVLVLNLFNVLCTAQPPVADLARQYRSDRARAWTLTAFSA